ILGGQNQLLAALIDRSEPVAGAMAAERGARLDRLVAASDDVLGATAAHRPELEAALERLPGALSTARSALVELSNLAGQTTPVLAALRPITGDLRQMAIELGGFADAAGPALASADPVLERARELVAAAAPVTAELRAAAGDVEIAARSTRTVVEALPEDVSNLLDFVRNASLAIGGKDSLSHYLRIFVLATTGGVGVVPADPPVAAAGPPVAGPPAPASAPAPSAPVLPLPGLVDQVGNLLGGEDRGSATGLTFDQERALLDYLLGAG
ncbi:MAG: MlaD family protein, partial [Acidimicrobiia bacterium]